MESIALFSVWQVKIKAKLLDLFNSNLKIAQNHFEYDSGSLEAKYTEMQDDSRLLHNTIDFTFLKVW